MLQAEAAKEMVADMQRQGLNPDIYTYAPLVGALGGAGRVEEAMQVWDDMRTAGVEPNSYVYVALINACERSSDWRRALRVFNTMKVRHTTVLQLMTTSFASCCAAYCTGAKHWWRACDLVGPRSASEVANIGQHLILNASTIVGFCGHRQGR